MPGPIINTEAISIARQSEDVYDPVTGNDTAGSITLFASTASVQPVSGRERLLLPEADRLSDVVNIYSEFEFLSSDIVIQSSTGKRYFLKTVRNWMQYDIPHVHAMGFLKDDA